MINLENSMISFFTILKLKKKNDVFVVTTELEVT